LFGGRAAISLTAAALLDFTGGAGAVAPPPVQGLHARHLAVRRGACWRAAGLRGFGVDATVNACVCGRSSDAAPPSFRGVTRHQKGRWEARIGQLTGRKYRYLGLFDTCAHAFSFLWVHAHALCG